jgi:hypothetical protein
VAGRGANPDRPILSPALSCSSPPRERTALCLYNEGYTAKDISEVPGLLASTARVYLNARRKTALLLENDHGLLQNG